MMMMVSDHDDDDDESLVISAFWSHWLLLLMMPPWIAGWLLVCLVRQWWWCVQCEEIIGYVGLFVCLWRESVRIGNGQGYSRRNHHHHHPPPQSPSPYTLLFLLGRRQMMLIGRMLQTSNIISCSCLSISIQRVAVPFYIGDDLNGASRSKQAPQQGCACGRRMVSALVYWIDGIITIINQ